MRSSLIRCNYAQGPEQDFATRANEKHRFGKFVAGAQRGFANVCNCAVAIRRVSELDERISSIPGMEENLSHGGFS